MLPLKLSVAYLSFISKEKKMKMKSTYLTIKKKVTQPAWKMRLEMSLNGIIEYGIKVGQRNNKVCIIHIFLHNLFLFFHSNLNV